MTAVERTWGNCAHGYRVGVDFDDTECPWCSVARDHEHAELIRIGDMLERIAKALEAQLEETT